MEKGDFGTLFGMLMSLRKSEFLLGVLLLIVWRFKLTGLTHHQTTIGLCSICGVEDECVFHALVRCPKARALRMAVREVWNLPDDEIFIFSGPN